MSNWLSTYLKKRVVRKNQNLVSLDEPFTFMGKTLAGRQISSILDAGASNASVSRRMLEQFPSARVYGFEPNPAYREQLETFATQDPRFDPQFLALADVPGKAELLVAESPGISSLFKPNRRVTEYDAAGSRIARTEQVDVVTIDDWAEENGVNIEVMKFDIQGAELKALQGAARTLSESTLMIYSEVWFNPCYDGGAIFSEIDSLLREFGFVLHEIFQPKYHPKGTLMWGNAIYSHAEKLGL